MKQFILFGLCALISPVVAGVDYTGYARLLERYVADDGVRYQAWAENPADVAALEDFLATLAAADVAGLSREAQTRLFAASDRAARVNRAKKSVAYSELFKRYADDFPGASPADYLNRYLEDTLPIDFKTSWIPYDWSLNVAE